MKSEPSIFWKSLHVWSIDPSSVILSLVVETKFVRRALLFDVRFFCDWNWLLWWSKRAPCISPFLLSTEPTKMKNTQQKLYLFVFMNIEIQSVALHRIIFIYDFKLINFIWILKFDFLFGANMFNWPLTEINLTRF